MEASNIVKEIINHNEFKVIRATGNRKEIKISGNEKNNARITVSKINDKKYVVLSRSYTSLVFSEGKFVEGLLVIFDNHDSDDEVKRRIIRRLINMLTAFRKIVLE